MSEPLNEQQITDLICKNPRAREVWSAGYQAGYLDGHNAATLSQDEAAQLTAHKFYAMEAHQEWLSKFVPATISAVEVEAYRRSPGSSYIPRKGDPRYTREGAGH